MKTTRDLNEARGVIAEGGILAYPTESVYGLGCDPFNPEAVSRLLALKRRSASKGFILLISEWSQLLSLIDDLPNALLEPVRASWPGPVTWLFPKAATISANVSGDHDTIAVRMSAHLIARSLCLDGPLISTSANLSGHEPAVDSAGVLAQFPEGIDALFLGDVGGRGQVSAIYDVRSGHRLR